LLIEYDTTLTSRHSPFISLLLYSQQPEYISTKWSWRESSCCTWRFPINWKGRKIPMFTEFKGSWDFKQWYGFQCCCTLSEIFLVVQACTGWKSYFDTLFLYWGTKFPFALKSFTIQFSPFQLLLKKIFLLISYIYRIGLHLHFLYLIDVLLELGAVAWSFKIKAEKNPYYSVLYRTVARY
jgi:hypothetical protein